MFADRETGRGERSSAEAVATGTPLGESRWPPVATVLVFMALNIAARAWLRAKERSTYDGSCRRWRGHC
ncbi:MAG: hypothetical protein ACJ780_01205 [Solirubrobacteraceae bacterium]